MRSSLDGLRFAVVDVEGNGQQPPEIVEIAIVPIDGLAHGKPLSWLVKPDRPITAMVTRKVHGIRNADVENCPAFGQIAPAVMDALAGRIPVAHNASVEHSVLGRHLPAWSPKSMLDTLRLAKKLWPGLHSYSLDPLLAHARVGTDDIDGVRHRAAFDAVATARLFATLAAHVSDAQQLQELGCIPALAQRKATSQPAQGGLW